VLECLFMQTILALLLAEAQQFFCAVICQLWILFALLAVRQNEIFLFVFDIHSSNLSQFSIIRWYYTHWLLTLAFLSQLYIWQFKGSIKLSLISSTSTKLIKGCALMVLTLLVPNGLVGSVAYHAINDKLKHICLPKLYNHGGWARS